MGAGSEGAKHDFSVCPPRKQRAGGEFNEFLMHAGWKERWQTKVMGITIRCSLKFQIANGDPQLSKG